MATRKSITSPNAGVSPEKNARLVRRLFAKLYRDTWGADVQLSLLKLERANLIPSESVNIDEMIRICLRTAERNVGDILDSLNDLAEALGVDDIAKELREIDLTDGIHLTTPAERVLNDHLESVGKVLGKQEAAHG